jgi:DNA polymerase I-like protein with 3'-5' exonuclease and polymerase domains
MEELHYTHIRNMFLLPRNFPDLEGFAGQLEVLQNSSTVFSNCINLEKKIQPILQKLELTGLVLSNNWFDEGLNDRRAKMEQTICKIGDYLPIKNNSIDEVTVEIFFKTSQLPVARSFEDLQRYKMLHPLYSLLLTYKKQQQFFNQWEKKLHANGILTKDGLHLKGFWTSYASYSGRIFAKELPLTSLPKSMRDYIVPPDGFELVSLDFSNAELRFLAYYSHSAALLEKFENQEDIHHETGTMIALEIGLDDTSIHTIRKIGKQFAFSLLYGAGTSLIASNLREYTPKVTKAQVTNIISEFYNVNPEVKLFLEKLENESKLLTPFGWIKPLASFSPTQRRNYPFQAGIAVAVKLLMVVASDQLEIIHVIHDEIWLIAPTREPTAVEELINDFYRRLLELLPHFPVMGLLKVETIGGNNNDK